MFEREVIVFFVRHVSHLANHVDPYFKFISDHNIDLVVLHTTDLTKGCASPFNLSDKSYMLVDISNFSFKGIKNILLELNPIGIVCYNFISLFDVFVIRLAQRMNIHTLYMEHGILNSQYSVGFNRISFVDSFRRYLIIARKYLGFLGNSSLINLCLELKVLANVFLKHRYESVKCRSAIFYSVGTYFEANKIFNYPKESVSFSGYPIFNSKDESKLVCSDKGESYVLFIHQPVIMARLTQISYSEEFALIKSHADVVRTFGYKLVVQIHPRESFLRYQNGLCHDNIKVIQESAIAQVVAGSSFVIGMYSTALLYAIYFKKPMFITKYPSFSYDYSFYFEDVGIQINHISDLESELLNGQFKRKLSEYKRYRELKLGANNSFEERVEAILSVFIPK